MFHWIPWFVGKFSNFGNLLRGNWIPNSSRVRLDILKIDSHIERGDETMQISLCCYSSGLVFWLGNSFTHGCFFYYNFSTNETSTYLKCLIDINQLHYLIDYCKWLVHRVSLPITCLTWHVFEMLFDSHKHSPNNVWGFRSSLLISICFLVIWDSCLQRFTNSLAWSSSWLISCHWTSWL